MVGNGVKKPVVLDFECDATFMQGRRPKQEDKHVLVKDLVKASTALKMPITNLTVDGGIFFLLEVFDGHQGSGCAEYSAKRFHMILLKKLTAISDDIGRGTVKLGATEGLIKDALINSIQELDKEFLLKYRTIPDGCTAIIALMIGDKLFLSWLGDSRAIFIKDLRNVSMKQEKAVVRIGNKDCNNQAVLKSAPILVTLDHKPEQEKERVEKAGGKIINLGGVSRVASADFEERVKKHALDKSRGLSGQNREPVALAVARSLGDREFKIPNKLIESAPDVLVVPEVTEHSCLFMSCDGVFDVMSEMDVVFLLKQNHMKPREASSAIVTAAYDRESADNLTCITAFFCEADEKKRREQDEELSKKRAMLDIELSREQTKPENFSASLAFCGSRPGWFFGTGDLGLGYYKDNPKPVTVMLGMNGQLNFLTGASKVRRIGSQ